MEQIKFSNKVNETWGRTVCEIFDLVAENSLPASISQHVATLTLTFLQKNGIEACYDLYRLVALTSFGIIYKLHVNSDIDLETLATISGRVYSTNDFAICEKEILRSLDFQILFLVASDHLSYCTFSNMRK